MVANDTATRGVSFCCDSGMFASIGVVAVAACASPASAVFGLGAEAASALMSCG